MTINALNKCRVVQFIPLIAHDCGTTLQRVLGTVQRDIIFILSSAGDVQRLPGDQSVTAATDINRAEKLPVLRIEDDVFQSSQALVLGIFNLFADEILCIEELLLALDTLGAAGLISARTSGSGG